MVQPPARARRTLASRLEDPAPVLAALAPPAFRRHATALKSSADTAVYRLDAPGLPALTVKCHALRPLRDAPKLLARRTRLAREHAGRLLLLDRGLAAADPLLLLRGRDERNTVVEALVSRFAEGPTLLECAARERDPARRLALARAAGAEARRLARARLLHRDCKPSNLVVSGGDSGREGEFTLTHIDTAGVRTARAPRVERTLFSLLIECLGVGAPISARERAEALIAADPLADRAQRRTKWRAVDRLVQLHGDPAPKTDPLNAPPARAPAGHRTPPPPARP